MKEKDSSFVNIRDEISASSRKRRENKDKFFRYLFLLAAIISAIMIILIFFFVGKKGIGPFLPSYGQAGGASQQQNIFSFLTGMTWRPDQNPAVYGVGFIIINTLISAFLAAILAFPISVLSALFIVKVAPKKLRMFFTSIVELLAAITSVVYGVFAAANISSLVDKIAGLFGQSTHGGLSTLTVALLLDIMIYPTITSIAINAIAAVDKNIELGSLALGASKTQTNFKLVLTAAKSGIFAGLILGLGRAFGEATAVSMVAGNAMVGPSFNLFDTTRTLTSTMLSGLHETSGIDYDIRFSVGIVLMIIVLVTNLSIQLLKRKIGGIANE